MIESVVRVNRSRQLSAYSDNRGGMRNAPRFFESVEDCGARAAGLMTANGADGRGCGRRARGHRSPSEADRRNAGRDRGRNAAHPGAHPDARRRDYDRALGRSRWIRQSLSP